MTTSREKAVKRLTQIADYIIELQGDLHIAALGSPAIAWTAQAAAIASDLEQIIAAIRDIRYRNEEEDATPKVTIRYRQGHGRLPGGAYGAWREYQVVHDRRVISRHDFEDQAERARTKYLADLAMIERAKVAQPSPHTETIRCRLAGEEN